MIPLKEWAEKHGIPKRTADQWAKDKDIPARKGWYEVERTQMVRVNGYVIDPSVDPHKLGLL